MPTALITGASSGIGLSFANQLAGSGYDLVLVARRLDRLETLRDRLHASHGISAEVLVADLQTDSGAAAVERRILEGDAIDLVINNAGYATRGKIAAFDYQAFAGMMAVNVMALVRLSAAAMRRMADHGSGAIINVTSGTAFMQMPGNSGYGSSKSFVVAFTRHMHGEAAGSGVHVQLLVPGLVATEFHEVAGADLANYPPAMVMQANDLVAASLRSLELGEPVCIPSLPDIGDWEAYASAEQALAGNVSRDSVAPRYL